MRDAIKAFRADMSKANWNKLTKEEQKSEYLRAGLCSIPSIGEMEAEVNYESRGMLFAMCGSLTFFLGVVFTLVYFFHATPAKVHVPEIEGVIGTWGVCIGSWIIFVLFRVLGRRERRPYHHIKDMLDAQER